MSFSKGNLETQKNQNIVLVLKATPGLKILLPGHRDQESQEICRLLYVCFEIFPNSSITENWFKKLGEIMIPF